MKKGEADRFVKKMANASSVGTSLAFSVIIGAAMGWWLDKTFGTKPWLFLLFMVCGIIAGFKNMIYFVKKTNLYDDENPQ
jgi:ATP synthase protein I